MTQKGKGFFTDAILISVITAELYAVAFAHEAGYLSYYLIPSHFIQPTVTTLALSGIACIVALLYSLKFIGFLTPLIERAFGDRYTKWRSLYIFNIAFLLPIIFVLAIFPWSSPLFFWLFGALLVFNLLYFGVPLIISKLLKEGKRADKVIDDVIETRDPFSIYEWLIDRGIITNGQLGLSLILILLIGMGWAVGNASARKSKFHHVIEETGNEIIIRRYNDILLSKPVDLKSSTFDESYTIRKVGEEKIKVARIKTGRLAKRKPDKSNEKSSLAKSEERQGVSKTKEVNRSVNKKESAKKSISKKQISSNNIEKPITHSEPSKQGEDKSK